MPGLPYNRVLTENCYEIVRQKWRKISIQNLYSKQRKFGYFEVEIVRISRV